MGQGEDMAAMEMAPGMPCEGMDAGGDPTQPVLCHQHCVNAPQAADPMKPPAVSLPAVLQVLVVPLLLDSADAGADLHANAAQVRPPPDPPVLVRRRVPGGRAPLRCGADLGRPVRGLLRAVLPAPQRCADGGDLSRLYVRPATA